MSADDVRPLRHSILRPSQPREAMVYAGDDLPDTLHLGAFAGDNLVGIASLYREDRASGPAGGWRLRGMATDPTVRGAGFGAALLRACTAHVAGGGGTEVWCNARLSAVGFYQRAGYEVVSDEFELEIFGAHVVMARPVPIRGAGPQAP